MVPGLAVACPVGCWMTGVGVVEPGATVRAVVGGVAGANVAAPGVPAQQEALSNTLAAVQVQQNVQHCVYVRVCVDNRLLMPCPHVSCRVCTP